MGEAVLQLNIPEKPTFIRRPYSFFHKSVAGRKLTRSELAIMGAVYSFSGSENGCTYSYSRFQREFGISRATVARAVSAMKASGEVSQDKAHKASAAYRFDESAEKACIRTELWLYTFQFEIEGQKRYLTKSEIDVLSLILSHKTNPNTIGAFVASVRQIAGILNLSATCVQRALDALLHADLIYRERGINGSRKSRYKANDKLMRKAVKKMRKEVREQRVDRRTAAEAAADERTERERYYAKIRAERESRKDYFLSLLGADEAYHRADRELRTLDVALARAEIFEPKAVDDLRKRRKSLTVTKSRRMAALGISAEDLNPPFRCEKCRDTGERADHTYCDCWRIQR